MKTNRSLGLADEAISVFWRWFSDHHRNIEAALDRDNTAELTRQMNAQIDKLSSEIAWEIGPGLVKPYMLVFPTAGGDESKVAVGELVKATDEGWEFHAARPTRPFPPEIQLPEHGLAIQTIAWQFVLEPAANSDRFNLHVLNDKLAGLDERTALSAVFILLDTVLGEDMVERWIGDVRVLKASGRRDGLPMPEISNQDCRVNFEIAKAHCGPWSQCGSAHLIMPPSTEVAVLRSPLTSARSRRIWQAWEQ